MDEYAGKTVVVTGASSGLGAGLASEFASHGLQLGLCSRRPPVLESSANVVAVQLDVTDGPAVDRFAAQVVQTFGTIDLWINNAGILEPIKPLRDIGSVEYRQHIDVNVMGVFHGSRAYARHVRDRDGGGVLVNISSGAARSGYAGWSAYCASKAAVDLMTECVALEEQDAGLRAFAVAPGVIDTAMQEKIRACTSDVFPTVDKFHQLKRDNAFSTPQDVAYGLLRLSFSPVGGVAGDSTVRVDLRAVS